MKTSLSKTRILLVNEFSQLATGYSVYGNELLKRLSRNPQYEIAELACYVGPTDPRLQQCSWKVYCNYPGDNDSAYHAKSGNAFGEYAFNRVCLDFRPDVVLDIRDWWHFEFEERSAFRDFYRWVIMPTVDASPQQEQWIASFMNADAVLNYSQWGMDTLKEEGGGLIKTCGTASPGADTEVFYPMDRKKLRKQNGFEDDVFIIGTVMRNQGRKLYPELMEAFKLFLHTAPKEMAHKTFLYLHVSYPDMGWDIPRLLKQYGLSHKTLFTYKCMQCNTVFPNYFMDAVSTCVKCGQMSACLPNTQMGIDRKSLAGVINLFDCYVQYANSEGFGMPMVEAASCGIPVFATDYSAMSDVVRKVEGYPINVDHYKMDVDLGCYRATPSKQDTVDKWINFFSKSEDERNRKSTMARQGVLKNYTWDATTAAWASVINGVMHTEKRAWNSLPNIHNSESIPGNFKTNEEFVKWAIIHILGQPERVNSYLATRLIRDLNWGSVSKSLGQTNYWNEQSYQNSVASLQKFGPDEMIAQLKNMCEERNLWEMRRWQTIQDSNLSETI